MLLVCVQQCISIHILSKHTLCIDTNILCENDVNVLTHFVGVRITMSSIHIYILFYTYIHTLCVCCQCADARCWCAYNNIHSYAIYMHIYIYIYIYIYKRWWCCVTGWQRLIGSPKLQIIFHKRATKYRSLLRKMSYKDKGPYESSPPCSAVQM